MAKRRVPGEFGFRRRHEAIALPHVMHVVDGDATAFEECWADEHGVDVPERGGQDIGFIREVPAERGIAPAGEDEADAGCRAATRRLRAISALTRRAAAAGMLREFVRMKNAGRSLASSSPSIGTLQSASTATSWTVWTPVGSSSSATTFRPEAAIAARAASFHIAVDRTERAGAAGSLASSHPRRQPRHNDADRGSAQTRNGQRLTAQPTAAIVAPLVNQSTD